MQVTSVLFCRGHSHLQGHVFLRGLEICIYVIIINSRVRVHFLFKVEELYCELNVARRCSPDFLVIVIQFASTYVIYLWGIRRFVTYLFVVMGDGSWFVVLMTPLTCWLLCLWKAAREFKKGRKEMKITPTLFWV